MLPYLIFFAILGVTTLFAMSRAPTSTPRALIPIAVLVLVMIGLRREVGGDWYNYLRIFSRIGMTDFSEAIVQTESGYAFANWVATRLGWGIWFPNLVCAAAFTWGMVALARRQPYPLLLIVAASYAIIPIGMGFTRQAAALGFTMLAITYYLNGGNWRVLLALIGAVLFHTSSLIIIPLLGLAAARQRAGTFGLALVFGAAAYLALSARISGMAGEYSRDVYVASGAIARVLINAVPAFIFIAFRQRFLFSPIERRLWTVFSLVSIGAVGLLFFFSSSVLVDRLVIYLLPLQLVILARLPTAMGTLAHPSLLVTVMVIIYSFTITTGWLQLGRWGSAWLPYRSYVWDWSPPRPREGRRWRE